MSLVSTVLGVAALLLANIGAFEECRGKNVWALFVLSTVALILFFISVLVDVFY